MTLAISALRRGAGEGSAFRVFCELQDSRGIKISVGLGFRGGIFDIATDRPQPLYLLPLSFEGVSGFDKGGVKVPSEDQFALAR